MRKISLILLFFTNFLHVSLAKSEQNVVPALFVFGDSLLDNGNNNFLLTLAKVDYPPYGMNFVHGPTGRFTNGKTFADFTAEFLGLPFAPPIISFLNFDRFTGVNYASGAAGILPESGSNFGQILPLDVQVNLFQRTLEKELQPRLGSTEKLDQYLSKCIFILSFGSNDYINNYLQPQHFKTSKQYSPRAFAKYLIKTLSQQLERLYKLGAKKFITFELGPIGCMPNYLHSLNPKTKCVDEYNQLVSYFNARLSALLQRQQQFSGSILIIGKISKVVNDMIQNPSKYGLIDIKHPCCVAINGTATCTPVLPACHNPDQYLWWDGYHLTQAPYSIIALDCFNGSSTCIPMSISQLVQA